MDQAVLTISWQGLAYAAVPTAVVIGILRQWTAGAGTAVYANARMLAQLLLIGLQRHNLEALGKQPA